MVVVVAGGGGPWPQASALARRTMAAWTRRSCTSRCMDISWRPLTRVYAVIILPSESNRNELLAGHAPVNLRSLQEQHPTWAAAGHRKRPPPGALRAKNTPSAEIALY